MKEAEQHRPASPPGAPPRPATPEVPDHRSGGGLIWASWTGTVVFGCTAVGAVASPSAFDVPALAVALALFFAGLVLFTWAYAAAASRSRHDEIAVAGLFGLSGSAPRRVRRHLLGSLGAQVGVGLATAAAGRFTSLAFGALVPVYGLALAGLWAARHGTFPPRSTADRRGPHRPG